MTAINKNITASQDGDVWKAGDHNTYVGDNINALFPREDSEKTTVTNSLNHVSLTDENALYISVASYKYTYLRNVSYSIVFSPIISRRLGGSTSDWTATGTVTQFPQNSVIQIGVFTSTSTSDTITFVNAYSKKPLIFTSKLSASTSTTFIQVGASTASFVLEKPSGVTIAWLAIGEM